VLRKPAFLPGGGAAQAESQAFLPQQGVASVPRSKTVRKQCSKLLFTSAKYEREAKNNMLLEQSIFLPLQVTISLIFFIGNSWSVFTNI
jgi:hypothetical protein